MRTINLKLSHCLYLIAIAITLSANAEQNHLEPLPLDRSDPVITSLLTGMEPRFWMITLPSFTEQQAIILDEKVEYKEISIGEYEVIKKQFFLKHASFKKRPRWKNPLDRNDPYEKINVVEDIENHVFLVDEDFVNTIEKAWTSILRETRYPTTPRGGLDGTTYIFHCDRYYGHIWSPDSGLPVKLVELGNKLSALAMSEEEDRETIKYQCLELAENIIQSKTQPVN